MCPADTSHDAAVNSAVSLRLDEVIDPGTVDNDSLTLRCGGALVSGSTTASGNRLLLEPDSDLPAKARCAATLGDGIRYLDGSQVAPVHWSFETGSETRQEWHFTDQKFFAGEGHAILDTVYTDDQWIIAHRFAGDLNVSVSRDNGETFLHSPAIAVLPSPVGATVEEFAMRYRKGVLYLTWSVAPLGHWPERFLAWSTSEDLLTYSEPLHLPALASTSLGSSPSIEIDDGGQIYVAWREQCSDNLTPSCPPLSIDGLHLAIYSPGGEVSHYEKLADWTFNNPQLSFIGSNLYIVWGRDPRPDIGTTLRVVEVHNYTAGMLELAERGNQAGPARQFQVDELLGDRALVTWTESDPVAEEYAHHWVSLDDQTNAVSELGTIVRVSDVSPEWKCSRVVGNGTGQIAFMLGSAADIHSPAYRGVHLSDDGGATFHTTMWMDDLGELYREKIEGDVTDDLCPSFDLSPEGFVHAVWHRVVYTQGTWDHTLLTARASQVSPCSIPTWSNP
jgi:hypothetical protein